MSTHQDQATVFAALPPPWPGDALATIRSAIAAAPHQVWILDDDPTGTQTIGNLPVLTHWETDTLRAEFDQPAHACFILTNSRALPAAQTRALHTELARNLSTAAAGRAFSVISRSDSTLRGHFPLETDVLAAELGGTDLTLIAPYFEAGGRYTLDDVHYLAEAGKLIPAAETPFARDAVFGYQHSHLKRWVEEKTEGRTRSTDVVSLSLNLIRREGPAGVARVLGAAPRGSVVIANAISPADIEVVAAGVLATETHGRRVLCRTAAAYVAARVGQRPPPLLTGREVIEVTSRRGGLIVAGSHVPKTTAQLERLRAQHELCAIELPVEALLNPVRRAPLLAQTRRQLHQALHAGRNTLLFTSRNLVTSTNPEANLAIGQSVSEALIDLVGTLAERPRFLIAKGGITSSDIATRALGVQRAMVRGQLLPGIPVWILGAESRFPGLGYVVFPGNVGDTNALADAVTKLSL